MNSYGSLRLVSRAIYKILRYMNFFPTTTVDDPVDPPTNGVAAAYDDDRITISTNSTENEPTEPIEPNGPKEPTERCAMCIILNINK
jgi:hypothetical protein